MIQHMQTVVIVAKLIVGWSNVPLRVCCLKQLQPTRSVALVTTYCMISKITFDKFSLYIKNIIKKKKKKRKKETKEV